MAASTKPQPKAVLDAPADAGAEMPVMHDEEGVPKPVGTQHSGQVLLAVQASPSERALLGGGSGSGGGGGGGGGPPGVSSPAWYLILDRFGFPTLVAAALGWMLWHMIDAEQQSHGANQVIMQKAFDQINNNLDKLNAQATDQQKILTDIKNDLKDALRIRR